MLIAIVDICVLPQDRAQVLSILLSEAKLARSLPGNLAFSAFSEAGNSAGIRLFHEWENQEAFDHYRQSRLFAHLNEQIRPLMSKAPISRRLTAERLEV